MAAHTTFSLQSNLSCSNRKLRSGRKSMMVLSTSGVVEAKESSSIPQNAQKSRIASGRSSSSSSHVTSTYVMPYAARRDLVMDSPLTVTKRVAYQGVPGAYSELASSKACPGWEHIPCQKFEMVFQALSQWNTDRAVLPVENSLGGSIHDVFDLLLRYNLHIVGEVVVPVHHCLMALPGVKMEDIRQVISHPQALSQCSVLLRGMDGVDVKPVDDTAGAAQSIAENGWRDVAAVASKRAAELYGMDILQDGCQDTTDNVTRFIVLSREQLVITQSAPVAFKTSLVFSLEEGPGSLWNALSVFALRKIDMTKIESRPLRTHPLVYSKSVDPEVAGLRRFNNLFFVDIVGSTADRVVQNALSNLKEFTAFVRVLGSYPIDRDL